MTLKSFILMKFGSLLIQEVQVRVFYKTFKLSTIKEAT